MADNTFDRNKGKQLGTVGGGGSGGSGDVTGPASAVDGQLAVFDGITGKKIKDGGPISAVGDVDGPASATDGNLAVFDGITGKIIKDGGAVPSVTGLVTGAAASLDNEIPRFHETTGKIIQQSGWLIDDTGVLYPNAAYDIGSTTKPVKNIYLDNGATDGGAIYFNAGTSAYLKSDAAGTYLQFAGFGDFRPTGYFQDLGDGAGANTAWGKLYLGSRYDDLSGEILFDSDAYATGRRVSLASSQRITGNETEIELRGCDRIKFVEEFQTPTLFTYPPIPDDSSELHWNFDDATPDTAIISSGSAAISLAKVGTGTITARTDYLGNSNGKGAKLIGTHSWYNATALAGRTINTKDFILDVDFHGEKAGAYQAVIHLRNASNKIFELAQGSDGIWYLYDTISGGNRFQFFKSPIGFAMGYHRLQLKFDRSNPSLNTLTIDNVLCASTRNDFGTTDTSSEDWDYEALDIGCRGVSSGTSYISFGGWKLLIGSVDGTMPTSTTVLVPQIMAPKTTETHSLGSVARKLKNLQLKVLEYDGASTPADADFDAAFGEPATVGAGFTALYKNTDAGDGKTYIVTTDGTSWFYASANLAS